MICEIFQQNIFINLLFIIKINAGLGRLNSDNLMYLISFEINDIFETDSHFGENMLYTSLKNEDCINWNTHKLNIVYT